MNLKWIHILLSLKLPRENDNHSTKETSELTRRGKQGPVLRERQVRTPGSSQFRRGNPREYWARPPALSRAQITLMWEKITPASSTCSYQCQSLIYRGMWGCAHRSLASTEVIMSPRLNIALALTINLNKRPKGSNCFQVTRSSRISTGMQK